MQCLVHSASKAPSRVCKHDYGASSSVRRFYQTKKMGQEDVGGDISLRRRLTLLIKPEGGGVFDELIIYVCFKGGGGGRG